MKMLLSLFTCLFLISHSNAQMTERDTVFSRFRSINIQNSQNISLQSDISSIKDVAIKSSYDHYYLKPGSFIRADSIDIEVNLDNKVLAITFFYDTSYTYKKSIYNKPLGAGKEFLFSSEDLTFKCTQWEDKLTVFELVEVTSKGKVQVYSVIFDKALFVGKYKHCLGSFNINYPFGLMGEFFGN